MIRRTQGAFKAKLGLKSELVNLLKVGGLYFVYFWPKRVGLGRNATAVETN